MNITGLAARWTGAGVLAMAMMVGGCASVGESGQRDQATADIGNYSPAPAGIKKPRVGVPPFSLASKPRHVQVGRRQLAAMASDQMTTLLNQTGRFSVIERSQLNQLLREQDLAGVVRDGELAATGRVRGVDYLLLGKITGFRVKVDRTSQEAGVQRGWLSNQIEGVTGGFSKNQTRITTELGVDIRLVDPASGEVRVANFTDFKRTDTAKSMGIDIAGVGASGDADVRIERDDAGKVLRMAFDDALKKAMSRIDTMLRNRHRSGGEATADAGSGGAAGSTAQAQATSSVAADSDQTGSDAGYCSNCGAELAAGAKFCPDCGEKVQ